MATTAVFTERNGEQFIGSLGGNVGSCNQPLRTPLLGIRRIVCLGGESYDSPTELDVETLPCTSKDFLARYPHYQRFPVCSYRLRAFIDCRAEPHCVVPWINGHLSVISPLLYLGGDPFEYLDKYPDRAEAAPLVLERLRAAGVAAIVNVANDTPSFVPDGKMVPEWLAFVKSRPFDIVYHGGVAQRGGEATGRIRHYHLPITERRDEASKYPPAAEMLALASDAIHAEVERAAVEGGKVLVHCVAGVNRSPSAVLMYLVRHGGMTLKEAFLTVYLRRGIAPGDELVEIVYREALKREPAPIAPAHFTGQIQSFGSSYGNFAPQAPSVVLLDILAGRERADARLVAAVAAAAGKTHPLAVRLAEQIATP